MDSEITKLLEQLKLRGMSATIEEISASVERDGEPPLTLLKKLLQEEWRYRQERSMHNRIQHAKLPTAWSIESFPF